jgi:predicted amidophosphoribosyltransferase
MDKWEQNFRCDICGSPIDEECGLCDACWEVKVWHS